MENAAMVHTQSLSLLPQNGHSVPFIELRQSLASQVAAISPFAGVLDGVGDIPIEIQSKLLRALQEREFERLGSTHTRKVNVRLIAATNRDLEKMIADREFRCDLRYRLHVFPIRIPPLRERKQDIPQLVSYFVQNFAKQMQKKIDSISPVVMKELTAWDWPGNIRELENFIERVVIVTRGRSLEAPLGELRKTNTGAFAHVEQHNVEHASGERTDPLTYKASVADEYERRQHDEIIRALSACRGRRVGGADGAAARLGVNRTTFLARIKKYGIYAKPLSTGCSSFRFAYFCGMRGSLAVARSLTTLLSCLRFSECCDGWAEIRRPPRG
jgi:transcriptional regulator with GAF, ATPase, and Fis domain